MKTELHWSHISYGTSVYSFKWQYMTKAGDVAGAEAYKKKALPPLNMSLFDKYRTGTRSPVDPYL